jgi:hypothetical protein
MRFILNNIFFTYETIYYAKQSRQPLLFLKLDFSKAYDKVDLGFLFQALERMGFPRMMKMLFQNAKVRVSINGQSTSAFPIQQGATSDVNQFLIDKVEKKLQYWITSWLGPVGCKVIVNGVLVSTCLYFLAVWGGFNVGVKKITGLIRNYYWSGSADRAQAGVAWSMLFRSEYRGVEFYRSQRSSCCLDD